MKTEFQTTFSVEEATNLLINEFDGELISTKHYYIEPDQKIVILIFNKYYMAAHTETSLVVTIDNMTLNSTHITLVSTGGSEGLLRMDYGSKKLIISQVENLFNKNHMDRSDETPTIEESFQSMYFSNTNIIDLQKEYHRFLDENKHITVLDQFEDTVKDEDDNDVFTIFITYLDSKTGNS